MGLRGAVGGLDDGLPLLLRCDELALEDDVLALLLDEFELDT